MFYIVALVLFISVSLIVMMIPLRPALAGPKVFRWRVQHLLSSAHPAYAALEKWCDHIKLASGGRLQIKLSPVGGIVPAYQQWEAVSKGVIQMALSYGAFWVGKTPMAAFSVGIPFTVRDIQDHYILQRLGLEELIRKAYAKHNIYFLRQLPSLASVMMSKKPVRSTADFKGLRIRAVGMIGEMLNEMGAAVISVPGPEIYGALERGIVDAAVYGPLSAQVKLGFHEVTKYVVMPPFSIEADEIFINMDAWNALPDDLKKLLYLSAADHSEEIAHIWRYDSLKALKDIQKKGLKVSYIPDEERAKLTKAAWKTVEKYSKKNEDFAKGANILKSYLELRGIMK